MNAPGVSAAGWEARLLLRAARVASLATVAEGQPNASLVTPACAADLSPLLLLSALSAHTRELRAEPRCALLVTGASTSTNPQTTPRLSLACRAEPDTDPALRARYLAIHPYAALYADFSDFSLWRLRPLGGQLVGGFARAFRFPASQLLPDAAAVAAIEAAAPGIIAHCNTDHADALAVIAGQPGEWRIVAVDTDGCDLASGETVQRIAWSAPAANAADLRSELVRLAREAREAAGERAGRAEAGAATVLPEDPEVFGH